MPIDCNTFNTQKFQQIIISFITNAFVIIFFCFTKRLLALHSSVLAISHVNRELVVPLQIITKAKGLLLGYLNKANVLF